jgi:hypothetical protein
MQFVRVMLGMGKDLGFFGIVWGILILAFRRGPGKARDSSP